MTSKFKDHFSDGSAVYGVYRPRYPKKLFSYLSSITHSNERAWDCAIGSGQSALELSKCFDEVVATDASKNQIDNATEKEGVTYKVGKAEKTSIENNSTDLITGVQTLHYWFNVKAFPKEANRILAAGLLVQNPGPPLGRAVAHTAQGQPRYLQTRTAQVDILHVLVNTPRQVRMRAGTRSPGVNTPSYPASLSRQAGAYGFTSSCLYAIDRLRGFPPRCPFVEGKV